tara:strand:- start:460 stop:840 length:381 start_codon:yes stop_codon:yes gene_type:complete
MVVDQTAGVPAQTQTVSNAPLENGHDTKVKKPVNIRIPVTPEFWVELETFLSDHSITASALKHAGMNYNTARKIVSGQNSRSVTSTNMQILMAVIKDPEAYRRPEPLGAITSIEEMMSLEPMMPTK